MLELRGMRYPPRAGIYYVFLRNSSFAISGYTTYVYVPDAILSMCSWQTYSRPPGTPGAGTVSVAGLVQPRTSHVGMGEA
jgi:hypothetical protein